jgi:hypothetical protein
VRMRDGRIEAGGLGLSGHIDYAPGRAARG